MWPTPSKLKYFRSLNGLLSKIGTSTDISVSLSLVSSFSVPVLFYGFDTGCLSKVQVDRLCFPFNSIYTKLFVTFDKSIVAQCQYYTGQLPLTYMLHLRFLNFLAGLKFLGDSPARQLYNWFGMNEFLCIAVQYKIGLTDSPARYRTRIWSAFEGTINSI